MIKSLFKETIRLQFNALMMKTIKGTLKQKKKQLVRFSKREVLFCELGETPLKEQESAITIKLIWQNSISCVLLFM